MVDTKSWVDYDREYLKGIAFFNKRRFFEAHEVWEEAWTRTRGKDREFLQGLLQTAVAMHHFRRGNFKGAAYLFPVSRRRLRACGDRYWGLDVRGLLSDTASFLFGPKRRPIPEIRWEPVFPVPTLLYDGKCGLCAASLRLLRALDIFGEVEAVDFRTLPDLKTLHPGLSIERCKTRIQFVEPDGRLSEGFSAIRRLSLKLILLWPLAPLLHIPGAGLIGRPVYDWIEQKR